MQVIKKYWPLAVAIFFILGTFLLVYRPTMFNFFVADDFWTLTWANQAVQHPQLLAQEYWRSKQALTTNSPVSTPLFYRPLFGTALFLEYTLWGSNTLYSRLVNITLGGLCGLTLGLIIIALNQRSTKQSGLSTKQVLIWSLSSAALFLLYPLHSEPVSDVSDIMDPLVTLLSFLSLWCYIQWSNKSEQKFFNFSIIAAFLAFLAKEPAAVLPATIFVYELLFPHNNPTALEANPSRLKHLRQSFIATLPYWLILAAYFCLRKIFLGDFIAGYPDSSCYPTLSGWIQGLGKIFIPINTLVIGTHSHIFKLWHLVLSLAILLNLLAITRSNRNNRKALVFLAIWFLLCLVPGYKIFPTLLSCGTGSRLVYLATAPLCTILTYGLAVLSTGNRFCWIPRSIGLIFLWLAAASLYANNTAWAEAGLRTNKIIQELKSYYQNIKGNPFVYVTGLPTSYKNIFSVGVLPAITKRPFMDRDIFHCVRLDNNEEYVNPGLLKEAIANQKKDIHLLYWDSESQSLKPVILSSPEDISAKNWKGNSLKQIIHVSSWSAGSKPDVDWLDDGTLEITSHAKENSFILIELNLPGLSGWNIDFLALKAQFVNGNDFGPFSKAELLFTNDIVKDYSKESMSFNSCSAPIKPTTKEQEVLFRLRNIPAWTMGGKCSSARIILPIKRTIKIKEILIPEAINLLPSANLVSAINDPPGQTRLENGGCTTQRILYDAHSINGCTQVMIEAIPASVSFEAFNSKTPTKSTIFKKTAPDSHGQFMLNRKDFSAEKTVYRARFIALNKTGQKIGVPSDELFIWIDPGTE